MVVRLRIFVFFFLFFFFILLVFRQVPRFGREGYDGVTLSDVELLVGFDASLTDVRFAVLAIRHRDVLATFAATCLCMIAEER